jgi:hypothetical protein
MPRAPRSLPASRPAAPGNADARIAPALPPAFDAFRRLHSGCYLGYAQLHLPANEAVEAVAHTLGHLLTHWPHVVSQPSPAAYAWQQLVAFTASRHHPLPLNTSSPQQYDTVILHHGLGYPLKAVADSTGVHPVKAAYLARSWRPSK